MLHELDQLDLKILQELQSNARLSNAELARRLNLSPPATHSRVHKLEEMGIIQGYHAVLNREMLGFGLLCFIHIRMHVHELNSLEGFERHVRKLDQVQECMHMTGQYDYTLKVALKDRGDLQEFIRSQLVPLRGVAQITTSILLEEIKSTLELPLGRVKLP